MARRAMPPDHQGDGDDDHQDGDGEPATGDVRRQLGQPEQLVVEPLRDPVEQRRLRIDRPGEFVSGRFVRGVAVDVDGGHCAPTDR